MLSKLNRINAANSVLFVCDVQQKFRPLIHKSETLIRKCNMLTETSKILNIPILVTEQYPKALGVTVPEINTTGSILFEKKLFSMMTPEVITAFNDLKKTNVILCGIEAHVCVLQTALDLIDAGIDVHIVSDAISSQKPHDRSCALTKMRDIGCKVTTTESIIFELTKSADHPNFKAISTLIKAENLQNDEFAATEFL